MPAASDSSRGEVATSGSGGAAPAKDPACAPDNGGITLPAGFCATIFADSVGGARHVAVAPNGDVFVALQTGRRRTEGGQATRGAVLALRDTDGDGRADVREYFGDGSGTGVAVTPGWVYADAGPAILRYPVAAGQLRPSGAPDTILTGLPMTGHSAHSFVLDGKGAIYVNVGSETNSCQRADRKTGSPGHDPCTELQTRAGIWRYAADRKGQKFGPGERFATGIRNAVGITLDPRDGALWAAQHGRDQLFQNWGQRFTEEQSAELPAEELVRVTQGSDFGWPYCYWDQRQGKAVLAPEYGGDGQQVGRCANVGRPATTFPGHWAPMAVLFHTGTRFPAKYRDGAFVSFHGSWNRAPLPQAGYRVVFVPREGNGLANRYETFADGFSGAKELKTPSAARHRPVGLAATPDGGMLVTDDIGGRVWKVVYTGK